VKEKLVQHLRKIAWEMVTAVIPALLIAFAIRVEVAKAVEIEAGPSMQPNMVQGYRFMVEKVSYYFHLPQRGDIVVVDRPEGEADLVKRVMGLPGETVEVRAGHVLINGQEIEEPWVFYFGGPDYGPAQIPDGHIFILGDNRQNSRDSRAIGPVELSTVAGRAWLIYWPLDKIELVP
jgi:signal peptidase I